MKHPGRPIAPVPPRAEARAPAKPALTPRPETAPPRRGGRGLYRSVMRSHDRVSTQHLDGSRT